MFFATLIESVSMNSRVELQAFEHFKRAQLKTLNDSGFRPETSMSQVPRRESSCFFFISFRTVEISKFKTC